MIYRIQWWFKDVHTWINFKVRHSKESADLALKEAKFQLPHREWRIEEVHESHEHII